MRKWTITLASISTSVHAVDLSAMAEATQIESQPEQSQEY